MLFYMRRKKLVLLKPSMLKNVVTFDPGARDLILDALDKSVDSEGFIVEKQNLSKRVLSTSGEQIKASELGAVKKGSFRFFKKDLPSVISLSDELK